MKLGLEDVIQFSPISLPVPMVLKTGEREGKRWCVPTEDWMGPGEVKLDEPIRKKLRGDEAGLLTDIDPPGVST